MRRTVAILGTSSVLLLVAVLVLTMLYVGQRNGPVQSRDDFTGVVSTIHPAGKSICVTPEGGEGGEGDCAVPIIDPDVPVSVGDEVAVTEVWLEGRAGRLLAYYVRPR